MGIDWRSSLLVVLIALALATVAGTGLPRAVGEFPADRAGLGAFRGSEVPWRVIGYSVQRRQILAARFGSGGRRVLYLGGVHGHEYGSEVAEALAQYLADHPAGVPRGAELHVIGCLNPDGRAAGTGPNARWVNLNRNLPTRNWSPSPEGRWGAGGPGSEPETKVLMRYLDEHRFDVVVSLHSKGPLIDYDGPGSAAMARRMSELSGIPYGHMTHRRPMTGSLGVFGPEHHGVPVITVELVSPELNPRLREALLAGVL